ncbi:44857_t:CDS:2, partial [Gigaspora margarita]
MSTLDNPSNISFVSVPLAEFFKRYEIYVTCTISIYFYDSIININDIWTWYSRKQWIISDLVCLILDNLRKFYNSPILLVSLFLFAGTTSILHVANIFGFGNFVEGNDGNCYLQKGGLLYLAIISSFQTINVLFILTYDDYLSRFINVTPTLILTSLCAQRLIIARTNKKGNNNNLTPPLSFKSPTSIIQNNGSIIINSMLEPPISFSRDRSIASTNSFVGIPISPPTPMMISDYGTSLATYFNNYTLTSLESSRQNSNYSNSNSPPKFFNNNNNSRLQVVQPISRPNSRESKRSTSTILQSIFRNNGSNNSISYENHSRRSNIGRSQGRVTESNDFYYFRYSEANGFDDDVFLFPAIPPQNPSISDNKLQKPVIYKGLIYTMKACLEKNGIQVKLEF